MTVNKLKLNVTKSLCMLIGTCLRVGGKTLRLSLDDSFLRQVSSTRYLGVCIDSHLTWKYNIEYVLKRVRGKIYSINCPGVRSLLYVTGSAKTLHVRVQILTYFYSFKMP